MKTTAVVVLGISLLLNLALLARRPAAAPEPPAARRPSPARVVAPAVEESRELEALRVRVRELETQKAARAEVVATPDPSTSLREKLLRAMKLWKDPKAQAVATPEALLELSEMALELQRVKLGRFKDPRAYVDLVRTVLEQAAAESKNPLNDGQREGQRRALDDYESALGGLEGADGWERFTREVGPEADVLQKLRTFVTPEQEAKGGMAFASLSLWNGSTAPWMDRRQAEAQIVQTWTAAYGLEEAQKPAVAAAVRVYLISSDALNAQMGPVALPGRSTPEWRRRNADILLDALGSMESSLTPEQRERLRQRRPAEVHVFDPYAAQRYAR